MTVDKKPTLRWNQHPLISTVLWILGTEQNGESDSKTLSQTKMSVLWKDEHGGSINEYFSQIQQINEGSSSRRGNSPLPPAQLFPRTFLAQEPDPLIDSANIDPSNLHSSTDNEQIIIDESPQWGFYVPITPPQQEMFAHFSKEVQSSIQHDQRKQLRQQLQQFNNSHKSVDRS
jgi:hypothetical protein